MIIGHVVGIDELTKLELVNEISDNIHVVDLDKIQQKVFSSDQWKKCKCQTTKISNDIQAQIRQMKLLNKDDMNISDSQLSLLQKKKADARCGEILLWKKIMDEKVKKSTNNIIGEKFVIFVGSNIYPFDYRVKFNIDVPKFTSTVGDITASNIMILDINPGKYAENQIRYYLNNHSNKIIKGKFPLELLNKSYLVDRINKLTFHYAKLGYSHATKNVIIPTIAKLGSVSIKDIVTLDYLYVARKFKCADSIPCSNEHPIVGYTKPEIAKAKLSAAPGCIVYIYRIESNQFKLIDGNYIANKPIHPTDDLTTIFTV